MQDGKLVSFEEVGLMLLTAIIASIIILIPCLLVMYA